MTIGGLSFDRNALLLLAAFALTLSAVIGFKIVHAARIADAVAVVDITGSMNTRDMGSPHGSEDRLTAARQALIDMIPSLPCQSRLGLGIFTERLSFLLFEPIDICSNYEALVGAISGLDWRMAWQGDSYIYKGLYSAIDLASSLKANLIFLTDGHEAPPLPETGLPPFEGKKGAVGGLIVGVGGSEKTPIPKFNEEGHQVGVYGPQDVLQANRFGLPPPGAENRPGYNPRNAPFGAMPSGDEQLSSVKSAHLRDLAARTGLTYVELQHTGSIAEPFLAAAHARKVPVTLNLAFVPALIALFLIVLAYAPSFLSRVPKGATWLRFPNPQLWISHRSISA
ncbi:vWA domain-containing protein [Hyphomicrobium sp.]|uniref:vWA domain-containing protein n=1 Tax=Hyphomicrobium sp. TaxID=82 RepID=UPI002C30DE8D|nr:vWA domain-containing protein [Hyphomicrobium sp.]HVZ04849.1 vWA domain-containing protein [Hyphomicrobium sp.]